MRRHPVQLFQAAMWYTVMPFVPKDEHSLTRSAMSEERRVVQHITQLPIHSIRV